MEKQRTPPDLAPTAGANRSKPAATDEFWWEDVTRQGLTTKVLNTIVVWQVNLLSSVLPNDRISQQVRAKLFGLLGAQVGRRVRLGQGIFVNHRHLHLLSIGDRSFVNCGGFLDLNGPITIGRHVAIGPSVSLITCTHAMGPASQRAGRMVIAPIRIGDGVWIGCRVVILPGVNIGRGSVIASGSVVSDDVPENSLAGGIPAGVIEHLGT